ncbi:TatD family hydrolase [Cognatilysobacter lacus]|uniref:TatD family deoxyribonuclease n=1 Tax=Cognatilysobacter lacus TaxID=1643323 RepID=A0A5D8Z5Z4_9GAMM|nr:TatD family hydrolase [Lysobacter lacus]TZF90181.1 TatD family deoxyribonuclease [Lysobacter lacus]
MLVDTHSHIDVPEFDVDRDAVIARARAAGVTQQVVPAIHAAAWPGLRATCARYEGLHAAYGLHPVYLDRHADADVQHLREWIERERPVAVGECGLDYFIDGLDRQRQGELFEQQLLIARDFDLPVIVHARRAVDAVIAALRHLGGLRGVVHSFSGSRQQAEALWREGFMLGLGGPVTYERANRLRTLVATMPIEHLLLETDAPDQPDAEARGARNEPARLVNVLRTIAELRGESANDVARATTLNAGRLFGFRMPASS